MTKKKPGEQFVTTLQALLLLQVLPDDPRDDAHGHAPLHIQTGDGKGHIILLSGHPVIIAGVRHRIDAVGKPDIDDALVDIGDNDTLHFMKIMCCCQDDMCLPMIPAVYLS